MDAKKERKKVDLTHRFKGLREKDGEKDYMDILHKAVFRIYIRFVANYVCVCCKMYMYDDSMNKQCYIKHLQFHN